MRKGKREKIDIKYHPSVFLILYSCELTADEYAAITAELDRLTVYGDRTGLTYLSSVPDSSIDQGDVYNEVKTSSC